MNDNHSWSEYARAAVVVEPGRSRHDDAAEGLLGVVDALEQVAPPGVLVHLVADEERLVRRQFDPPQPRRRPRVVPVEVGRVPLGGFGPRSERASVVLPTCRGPPTNAILPAARACFTVGERYLVTPTADVTPFLLAHVEAQLHQVRALDLRERVQQKILGGRGGGRSGRRARSPRGKRGLGRLLRPERQPAVLPAARRRQPRDSDQRPRRGRWLPACSVLKAGPGRGRTAPEPSSIAGSGTRSVCPSKGRETRRGRSSSAS